MAGISRTKALLHFPLDIDRPSHGRERQNEPSSITGETRKTAEAERCQEELSTWLK